MDTGGYFPVTNWPEHAACHFAKSTVLGVLSPHRFSNSLHRVFTWMQSRKIKSY